MPRVAQERDRGEAVQDVGRRGGLRIADRGQVDGRGPGQQEPDVALDGVPGSGGRASRPRRASPASSGRHRSRPEGRGVLDARRERLALGSSGTPPDVCVPSVLARRRSRRRHRVAPWRRFGLPRSVRFPAGSPRAPRGPRYPGVSHECGCRTVRGRPRDRQPGYPRSAPGNVDSWITPARMLDRGRPRDTGRDRPGRSPGRSGRGGRSAVQDGPFLEPRSPPRRGRVRSSSVTTSGASPSVGPGSASMNVEPASGTLATTRSPPIARARSRAIGRPRPVPGDPVVTGHPVEAFEDPRAVVGARCRAPRRGRRRGRPARRTSRPARVTIAAGVNLSALAMRFGRICSTRRRSPVAARSRGGRLGPQRDPALHGDRVEAVHDAGRASASENGRDRGQRPGLEAGELEQVADELGDGAHDAATALQELALDGRVVDRVRRGSVEIAGQAGQRRAQLVGHGGHERSSARSPGRGDRPAPVPSPSWWVTRARATAACRARVRGNR